VELHNVQVVQMMNIHLSVLGGATNALLVASVDQKEGHSAIKKMMILLIRKLFLNLQIPIKVIKTQRLYLLQKYVLDAHM
jgi:hypothetical protein